jgi:uncharacterized protein YvpB
VNRSSIPAWQITLLIFCFGGALLFGAMALVQIPSDPAIQGWIDSNPLFATLIPSTQSANFQVKESTLSIPSLTPSPTSTQTASPTSTATPTPTSTPSPTPTSTETSTALPTETPAGPPDSATVDGVHGYAQYYALSCESRSASDLAAFFGLSISEIEFQAALPRSDDPDSGFVGEPWGWGGQIPPYSYGVNAAPVAALLRAYGLPAQEQYGMNYENLQREIAAGRPVMVWVISGLMNSTTIEYTAASNGHTSRVAYGEHTMLVIGYTPDTVTVQDGGWAYSASLSQFLNSWAVLGNMAITVDR